MRRNYYSLCISMVLLFSNFFCAFSSPKNSRAAKQKTNVVFILVDDLGWKDLGCMGSSYYETPNIDGLAKESILFTNGYAGAANCAPSRACLMSGQSTTRHGVYTVGSSARGNAKTRKLIPVKNTEELSDEMVTLGEMFKKADYSTIALGKWHLGEDPTTQGFDVNVAGDHRGNPGGDGYFAPYNVKGLSNAEKGEFLTDRLTQESIRFIEKNKDTPFFVYLSYYAVHTPLQAKPELIEKYQAKPSSTGQTNATFAGMVETVDTNVGKILETLRRLDLEENTMVVFTSDNGGIRAISHQDPLRAGKGSYYEGGIRVPYLIKYPEYNTQQKVCDVPVVNLDLFPTFKEMLGVSLPNKTLDGRSLLPYIKGNKKLKEIPLYWHFPVYLQAYKGKEDGARDPLFRTRPGSAMRYGKWKLIEFFEDGAIELYNLQNDLNEQHNIANSHPKKVKELYAMLEKWRKEVDAPIPTEKNSAYNETFEAEKLSQLNR